MDSCLSYACHFHHHLQHLWPQLLVESCGENYFDGAERITLFIALSIDSM